MVLWLGTFLGSMLGTLGGFFGTALVFIIFEIGTGSYEDALLAWLITVPGGFVFGTWAGYRAALSIRRQRGP